MTAVNEAVGEEMFVAAWSQGRSMALEEAIAREHLYQLMISFNAQHGLIIVHVTLYGPTGDTQAFLALGTGATSTVVSKEILVSVGYAPDAQPKTVRMTTGSGIESASRINIDKMEALRQERLAFSVVAHTLPPTASVDGVLGLDFLRNHILTLDFQKSEITLA